MIVITQNMFLFLGVIICLFLKRNLLINIITRKNLDNNLNVKKEIINLIFFVYIVGVISKVYFPLTLAWGKYVRVINPVIILNPINSIKLVYGQGGIDGFIYNFGGNFILLIPMGMFIAYYFNNIFNTLKRVFISMFLVSLFIESTQVVITLIFPNVCRYFETSDLLLNSIGGILGWKVYNKLFDMYNNKILSRLMNDL